MIGSFTVSTNRFLETPAFQDRGVFGSSFKLGLQENLLQRVYRSADMFWKETIMRPSDSRISKEVANDKYGIEGILKFDSDTTEYAAQFAYVEALKKSVLEKDIAVGMQDDMVGGFSKSIAATLVASFFDPAEIALTFFPVVGSGKKATNAFSFLSKQRTAFANMVNHGFISETKVSTLFGGSKTLSKMAEGAIEGSVGTAVAESLYLGISSMESREQDLEGSIANVALGTLLGTTIQGALPTLKRVGEAMSQVDKSVVAKAVEAGGIQELLEGDMSGAGAVIATDRSIAKLAVDQAGYPATKKNLDTMQAAAAKVAQEDRKNTVFPSGTKEIEIEQPKTITQDPNNRYAMPEEYALANEKLDASISRVTKDLKGYEPNTEGQSLINKRAEAMQVATDCYLNFNNE